MKQYRIPMIKITDLTPSDPGYLCGTELDASVGADFGSDFGDTDEW